MNTDEAYNAFQRGQVTRALARLAVKAHRARRRAGEPEEPLTPTRAEPLPDSFVWVKRWGFWWKRPTLNTRMRHLPKLEEEQ